MFGSSKPLILTGGDPSGIGPEITVKAWKEIGSQYPFAVLGDTAQFSALGAELGVPLRTIERPADTVKEALCVIPQAFANAPKPGQTQLNNAVGTIEMIRRAVGYVQNGDASAIVTNPIQKQVLVDGAGFSHPGHTEYLATLDDKTHSVMMLATDTLKVVPVTIHIPLCDVGDALTEDLLISTIQTLHHALLNDFGIDSPRIAVAGLNPHAGEGGKMGDEELKLITPVLNLLRKDGLDLIGPKSADTMFHARTRKTYDAAVCMYHDQALIPIKTIDFDRGVNITLGLSFVRTSPDHGTAYDIAGKGLANPTSLIEAIKTADQMARNRMDH